jgi:hypothetical protein
VSADSDVGDACSVLRRVPPLDDSTGVDGIRRVDAAAQLAEVAANGDVRYKPLADSLDSAVRSLQGADLNSANASITQSRTMCSSF